MKEKTNPALTFPHQAPELSAAVEIAKGVFWLRVPIPFELNHINVWLLDDGDSYTLIDTGIDSSRTRDAWEPLLGGQFSDKPIKTVIVTHFHPDHFGLAGWLTDRFSAQYWTSKETQERTDFLLKDHKDEGSDDRQLYYQQHGIEDREFFENFLKGTLYRDIVSGSPDCTRFLDNDERLRIGEYEWRLIMTYGHAAGQITLHCEELGMLISGDQILPTITSNVSVHADQPEQNPLQEYLLSFKRYDDLAEDTLVLPSHGKVFTGIHKRISQIIEHHEAVLEKVFLLCEDASCVNEVVPKLFRRKLEGMNIILAFGEALANLNYLYYQGKIQRLLSDGLYRYQQ